MTVVFVIAKIIQGYQGYKRDCRKEDDVLVKQKIIDELSILRTCIIQMNNDKTMKDQQVYKELKSLINNIDVFIQEVEYSLSGHSYPFFSIQTSVGSKELKKIMKLDLSLLNKTLNLSTFFNDIRNQDIQTNDQIMIEKMRFINQKITEIKNDFKTRNMVIKKI